MSRYAYYNIKTGKLIDMTDSENKDLWFHVKPLTCVMFGDNKVAFYFEEDVTIDDMSDKEFIHIRKKKNK